MRTLCLTLFSCFLASASWAAGQSHQLTGQSPQTPPPASESWTKKLTSWIPGNSPKAPKLPTDTRRQKHDPTSLGYASGPPNAALYLSMAELSDRGGNIDHARAMYLKAISIDPANLDAMLGLARLEDREGRFDQALRVYQDAVARHPHDARALNDLALCLARSGQLPRSLHLLEQAVRLRPEKQLYRNNTAKVLIAMNRVDHASFHLQAVHPPEVANYNLAVLLIQAGRQNEAVRYLHESLSSRPEMHEARSLLAQLTGGPGAGAPAQDAAGQQRVASSFQPRNNVRQAPEHRVGTLPSRPDAATARFNDGIVPTPMAAPQAATAAVQPYPTTGAGMTAPAVRRSAAETAAQMPMRPAAELLPPIR